ncbi:MAG: hypothetical protein J6M06_00340 [Synergistaceae bacterium]|nr:hypothetical protein [Synergistaceae bacterium]
MAFQTFDNAVKNDSEAFLVTYGGKTYEGFFANVRVDRETLPKGWYAYDMVSSDNDNGKAAEIRGSYVYVNHFGTFCTKDKLPLADGEAWTAGEFEYSFADSEAHWRKVIQEDGLECVPEDELTADLCLHAVEISADEIERVPEKFFCEDLFLAYVDHDGTLLENVPEKFRTWEVCDVALNAVDMDDALAVETVFDSIPSRFLDGKGAFMERGEADQVASPKL